MDKQAAYREGVIDGRSGQDHRNEPAYNGMRAEYVRGLNESRPMHTPGPWYQTASDPAGICVYAEDRGAHRRIAVLDACNVSGAGAANARLIAAAPEMLEIIKELAEHHHGACLKLLARIGCNPKGKE